MSRNHHAQHTPSHSSDRRPDGPLSSAGSARRRFLIETGAVTTGVAAARYATAASPESGVAPAAASLPSTLRVRLNVNGRTYDLTLDPRVTLLDALREHLALTGTKKGCDRGQCGACTVLLDGRRVNSCLTLAAAAAGSRVTTVEGLARGGALHRVQQAFIQHDGFQCGYCTSGQICSAVALLDEARAGAASAVTPDVRKEVVELGEDEIRERMSGNLCRCGAYVNIVAAIQDAAKRTA